MFLPKTKKPPNYKLQSSKQQKRLDKKLRGSFDRQSQYQTLSEVAYASESIKQTLLSLEPKQLNNLENRNGEIFCICVLPTTGIPDFISLITAFSKTAIMTVLLFCPYTG